ncbi:hypothetical protein [Metallibacterium sp.]|uniref:hypothetical protein n=1 Tax=Metallibacterium sp. TaxID=2940281 RepID=UPI00262A92C6|nr:hypothetical protein [Metallibacterium sp.]
MTRRLLLVAIASVLAFSLTSCQGDVVADMRPSPNPAPPGTTSNPTPPPVTYSYPANNHLVPTSTLIAARITRIKLAHIEKVQRQERERELAKVEQIGTHVCGTLGAGYVEALAPDGRIKVVYDSTEALIDSIYSPMQPMVQSIVWGKPSQWKPCK